MGISSTLIGINTAVAGLASLVTIPFVPWLAARIGVLPFLWLSIALAAISLIGFKLLFSFWWWFPVRFVFSAALGALLPPSAAVPGERTVTGALRPRRSAPPRRPLLPAARTVASD